MRILLDTHVLLWLLQDDPQLTEKARSVIAAAGEVYFSSVSIEEIAIKHSLKPSLMPSATGDVVSAAFKSGIKSIDFSYRHAVAVGELPWHHRDPFDRMLIAQARSDGFKLLSHDDFVIAYGDCVIGF